MRIIKAQKITEAVRRLCLKANFDLRDDVLAAIKLAWIKEKNRRAKSILKAIIDNASIAREEKLAICQDTGLPSVFLELGQGLKIEGDLEHAVQKGIEQGYGKGYLRSSVVRDPLQRKKSFYSPGIIHVDLVRGNKIKITLMPKGFGCENKSQLKMFNPTAKTEEIKKFIIDTVKSAGPDACPPYVVGVGIGGSADFACLLAKKALLRKVTKSQRHKVRSSTARLEQELLIKINRLGIGPMGLGGKTTALAVNIGIYPTHIAGLPVAVNISCHALRSATAVL